MYTKQQQALLKKFADLSDNLFEFGIISTDSFTGEIGEFIVCKYFKLKKSNRVTQSVDGVCNLGKSYQIKSKIVSNNNFNYTIKKLDTSLFHFLVVIYFDKSYNPIKILRIPSSKIKGEQIIITPSIINSGIEVIDKSEIKIPVRERKAINEFAKIYNQLEEKGVIRSRRVVGDIGELYASKRLGLEICSNRTEKGIDARHKNGLTFEIKTRRVYESERRVSETRRLNNLVGKSADYLVVVVLDRSFKCAGMWLIPMQNINNPKSASLKIVNTTPGAKNLIPSQIDWLKTGSRFTPSDLKRRHPQSISEKAIKPSTKKKIVNDRLQAQSFQVNNSNSFGVSYFGWAVIIVVILYLLRVLLN
jgi:hypothetical protein